jgi:hypothetical protein
MDYFEAVIDTSLPIKERANSARALAIRLVRNEVDFSNKELDFSAPFADDLNNLLKNHVESRFTPDAYGKRFVKAATIFTPGKWGAFLWRGATVQHLYTINSYRNLFEHINEQPYRNTSKDADSWLIKPDALDYFESGEAVGKVLEIIVRDLLRWYLPWHEQVYLPWARGISGAKEGV